MADTNASLHPSVSEDDRIREFGHPRGALAVVIIFGALFAVGWLAFYVFLFLGRGGTHA